MRLVKSKNGFQFWGRDGGKIGPAALFFNVEDQPNLAGTVAATASATLTGTGTAFTTALNESDFVEIMTATPIIGYVHTITSATSITIHDPDDLTKPLVVTVPALTNIRPYKGLWLGKTAPDGIKVMVEESTVETKSSDNGETVENVYSSGVAAKFEFTLMEPSLDAINKLLPGMFNVTKDVNGFIVASSVGTRPGYDYKSASKQLAVIEYAGQGPSKNPGDRLDAFKVAFQGVFAGTKNSTDQQGLTLTGFMFPDDTRRVNNVPQFMATNLPAMLFD